MIFGKQLQNLEDGRTVSPDPLFDRPSVFVHALEKQAVLSGSNDEFVFAFKKESSIRSAPGRIEQWFRGLQEERYGLGVVPDLPVREPAQSFGRMFHADIESFHSGDHHRSHGCEVPSFGVGDDGAYHRVLELGLMEIDHDVDVFTEDQPGQGVARFFPSKSRSPGPAMSD